MKQTKQGFLFRFRWAKLFARLDEKQRSILLDAIFACANNEPVKRHVRLMKSNTQLCWEIISDELAEDIEAYNARCERNRTNGCQGGRPAREKSTEPSGSEKTQKNRTVILKTEKNPDETEKNPEKPKKTDQNPAKNVGFEKNPIRLRERDKDKDVDLDKDKEREKEAISLSHKKFCENFPDRATACTTEKLPEYFDIGKLLDRMKKSDFLTQCNNLDFDWCVNHHDEIIAGKYDNFKLKVKPNESASDSTKIKKREYSDGEKSDIFDNFENLNLEE